MRVDRLVLTSVAVCTLGGLVAAEPRYSEPLDQYTLGRAKADLMDLATREGIEQETAELLLKLDVFATSSDTGCPGVDVDVINSTARTVWNIEVLIEQKDAGKNRTDTVHLPYMLPNTKARISVSCLQDYTYRSRYDYQANDPISLSYSAKGSKSIDEALPLMLAQPKDYSFVGMSISPRPDADGNLLEDALEMNDEAVAKELVQAIARTGIGRTELGNAIAENGTGALADEVVASLAKLPAAQQAQLARTLLASSVAERWKDKLAPMIESKLCSGNRAEVVGLWIQAQGETGIPVQAFRDRIREKCKPSKADGPGMIAALEKDATRAGPVIDAVDADLFASVTTSWKAWKGDGLPTSQLAFLRDGQTVERFEAAAALIKPEHIPAAMSAVLRSPEGPAVAAKAAWVTAAMPKVAPDDVDLTIKTKTEQLVSGEIPAQALRDAARDLAKFAPKAAEDVMLTHARQYSKVFDPQKVTGTVDMGEFLAFNATLGDCTATIDLLAACATKIAAFKDRKGDAVLVKIAREAVLPEFMVAARKMVNDTRNPDGLIAIGTALSSAGFDASFVADQACRDAQQEIAYDGDPEASLALAAKIDPKAACIEEARDAQSSKKRKALMFTVLAIMGLVLPIPAGGFLMKRRWKKVQKQLPADTGDDTVTGAKLDDRLGTSGLGRALRDGIAEARRELAGTPPHSALEGLDDSITAAATTTVARAVKAGDAATLIVRRSGEAVYIVALPVREPRPQVVQRYLGAPWPEHLASIQRVAGMPVLALIVLCGPEASEASLLVGYSNGARTSDPDVLLDAKEARDRGANRFRHVMTLSSSTTSTTSEKAA